MIWNNSKNQQENKNENERKVNALFDMSTIGRRISSLRKEKNITQMALADMMGISFQAVSNWERGESMPDISKLGELSEILGVSIDELLGKNRGAKIVENIIKDENSAEMLTAEEIAEVAPIMEPKKLDETIKKVAEESSDGKRKYNIKEIVSLAPFMSEDAVGELVRDCVAGGASIQEISSLAPFMDEDDIGELVKNKLEGGASIKEIISLAPFMDEGDIGELVKNKLEGGASIKEIISLAPFMDEDDIGELVKNKLEGGASIQEISSLAPFMCEDDVAELVKKIIKNNN